jgi:arylesterase/paraoxonase
MKQISLILRTPVTSVGYCHVDEGCKLATPNIHDANGIASVNDTFYVANSLSGTVTVLERQTDNSLVLTDVISIGKPDLHLFNISENLTKT